MTKRTKEPRSPSFWEAVHKADDWDRLGVSHREIAKRLWREGYTLGKGKTNRAWSDMAVTRALDVLRAEDELKGSTIEKMFRWSKLDDYVEVNYPDGGQKLMGTALHPDERVGAEETFEAFKAKVKAQHATPQSQRTYPEIQPRDWTSLGDSYATAGQDLNQYENQYLAGQDWGEKMVPLIVRQIEKTGHNALDVLDGIKGHESERRLLKTLFFGMMKRQAMLEETVLALKVKHEGMKLRTEAEIQRNERAMEAYRAKVKAGQAKLRAFLGDGSKETDPRFPSRFEQD